MKGRHIGIVLPVSIFTCV